MTAEIINSIREAVSFEEKYEEADAPKTKKADEMLAKYSDVIRLATNPEKINECIKDNLISNLTLPELGQVLKWYQTPLGKKISETELEKYIAFSETAARRHFYSLLRKKTNIVLLDSNKKILMSIVRVMSA